MNLFRLSGLKYRGQELSGEGAFRYPGRWNEAGQRVVYLSQNVSLSLLETLVHAGLDTLPGILLLSMVQLDDDLFARRSSVPDLPQDWDVYPSPQSTKALGANWFARGETLILEVPSAIVRQERNFLINTTHADFARIGQINTEEFRVDPRLF